MSHLCHWPGCPREVDPKFWGCVAHWFRLPEYLRKKIWAAYMPGQEIGKTPSADYITVAREVQAWIASLPVVKCGECGAPMVLRPYQGKQFYGCTRYPECDGTHGAHPNGAPLGIPADKATKAARMEAHAAFDKLWRDGSMTRKGAYAWLCKSMGLSKEQGHIGRFSAEQCHQLQELLEQRPSQAQLF